MPNSAAVPRIEKLRIHTNGLSVRVLPMYYLSFNLQRTTASILKQQAPVCALLKMASQAFRLLLGLWVIFCARGGNYSLLSVGIVLGVATARMGVLVFTQTFSSFMNLVPTTSQASPMVLTGKRRPLGVAL